jgi:hypothetical protein
MLSKLNREMEQPFLHLARPAIRGVHLSANRDLAEGEIVECGKTGTVLMHPQHPHNENCWQARQAPVVVGGGEPLNAPRASRRRG